MTSELMPSVAEGAIYIEPVLWPWPPQACGQILSAELQGGVFQLFAEETSQFRVVIRERSDVSDKIVHDCRSCAIVMVPRAILRMSIGWDKQGVTVRMNGHWILASGGEHVVPEKIQIAPLSEQPKIRQDFSKENGVALERRSHRLKSLPVYPGKSRGDQSDVGEALRRAARQLSDFLATIEAGKDYHVESLASLLRKLISTGDPMPLLQLCAAYSGAPLIVYGPNLPKSEALAGSDLMVGGSCWSSPTDESSNPMDIDVWLDLFWGRIVGENFTHRRAITKIGDTIGSHFDLDKHPTVALLKATGSDLGGVQIDSLCRYLHSIGSVVLSLSNSLLAKL